MSTVHHETVFAPEAGEKAIYINSAIKAPQFYTQEFELLRNATEDETINVYLRTLGGYLSTTAHFISLFDSCRANLLGHLVGPIASAGTIMAMKMDDLFVYDSCYMMMHNYSGGGWGKGDDLVLSVLHDDAWVKGIMRSCYKDFLTEDEIEKELFRNQDIYLFPDQIISRWERVLEARTKEAENHQSLMEEEQLKVILEQHGEKLKKLIKENSSC